MRNRKEGMIMPGTRTEILPITFLIIVTLFSRGNNAQSQTLRITSILYEPYLMLKELDTSVTGNDRFEGFSKDLADSLSRKLNLNYTLTLVRDGSYGSKDGGGWNGMIGELVQNVADIAIAPLTMTSERAEAVDFSPPFLEFQLKIALQRPPIEEDDGVDNDPGSYMFLRPFSGLVWLVLILSLIILVILLYILERCIPLKEDPNRKARAPTRLCVHGICGSPRTSAGRLLQIVFWVFVLILIGAYIAGFTSDRIVDRLGEDEDAEMRIKSLSDLAAQREIKYGMVRYGSTYQFFRNSWDRLHRKMYAMMIRASTMTATTDEGFERVRNGTSYAFIAEGPTAEYQQMKTPQIELVPGSFGPRRAFGVAMRKSLGALFDKVKDRISVAILQMKENGEIELLRQKWFRGPNEEIQESDSDGTAIDDSEMEDALCLYRMAGVFYILLTAIIVALIVAAIEIFLKTRKLKSKPEQTVEIRLPTREGQPTVTLK